MTWDDEAGEHEQLSASERRLLEHLEVVSSDSPEPRHGLAAHLVRRARWQSAMRSPLKLIEVIAGAFVEGGKALAGGSGRPRR